MAFLDETALGELWARIGQVFARLTQAVGDVVYEDTVLKVYKADGTLDASYSLDDGLATDVEAASAEGLSRDGMTLKLQSVDGSKSSSVSLSDALDSRYGADLSMNGRTLSLKSKSGADLRSVTIPDTDISGKMDTTTANTRFIASAGIKREGDMYVISFYDGNNDFKNSVSWPAN